jgi:hypothetical protein
VRDEPDEYTDEWAQKIFEKTLARFSPEHPPQGQTWEQFVNSGVEMWAADSLRVTVPDWAKPGSTKPAAPREPTS